MTDAERAEINASFLEEIAAALLSRANTIRWCEGLISDEPNSIAEPSVTDFSGSAEST
jgi:hypothetical protein